MLEETTERAWGWVYLARPFLEAIGNPQDVEVEGAQNGP
jgi:hypothetical protein